MDKIQMINDAVHEFYIRGGEINMSQIDELDFERMKNLAEGFGWRVKQTEIKNQILVLILEKDREEPETDITVQPT